jgi:hypothetical protein
VPSPQRRTECRGDLLERVQSRRRLSRCSRLKLHPAESKCEYGHVLQVRSGASGFLCVTGRSDHVGDARFPSLQNPAPTALVRRMNPRMMPLFKGLAISPTAAARRYSCFEKNALRSVPSCRRELFSQLSVRSFPIFSQWFADRIFPLLRVRRRGFPVSIQEMMSLLAARNGTDSGVFRLGFAAGIQI